MRNIKLRIARIGTVNLDLAAKKVTFSPGTYVRGYYRRDGSYVRGHHRVG